MPAWWLHTQAAGEMWFYMPLWIFPILLARKLVEWPWLDQQWHAFKHGWVHVWCTVHAWSRCVGACMFVFVCVWEREKVMCVCERVFSFASFVYSVVAVDGKRHSEHSSFTNTANCWFLFHHVLVVCDTSNIYIAPLTTIVNNVLWSGCITGTKQPRYIKRRFGIRNRCGEMKRLELGTVERG